VTRKKKKQKNKPKIIDMTSPKRVKETEEFNKQVDRMQAAFDGLDRLRREDELRGA